MSSSLPSSVVGLDIETTALDPAQGDIIEVVAIRYSLVSGQELERFERLCAASRPLSPMVMALTGITNELLSGQPAFAAVKEDLQLFIAQDYLLAHNAQFDLSWLAAHGLRLVNPVWDTFFLATVAWPQAASYNLGMLAEQLGIVVAAEHRAAADIRLTWQIFQKLRQVLQVPASLEATIRGLLGKSNLGHYQGLFSVGGAATRPVKSSATPLAKSEPSRRSGKALRLDSVLGERGRLGEVMPGFSVRPIQQQMARRVEQAMTHEQTVFIEAGTGIGKTYAYLVPLLLRLRDNGRQKAIVSTYTRNLQDQIFYKDLPQLLEALRSPIQAAVLKGRKNYVCRERLADYLKRPSLVAQEAWVLIKILLWMARGGKGDLEQLNFSHQGERVVSLIHADHAVCRRHCRLLSLCPYRQAAEAAAGAQLLIVNHALLLQMGQAGRSPGSRRVKVLVIDEAHHLEEAARSAAMIDFSGQRLRLIIADLCGRRLAKEGISLLAGYEQLLRQAAVLVEKQAAAGRRLLLNGAARAGSHWQRMLQEGRDWLARFKLLLGRAQAKADRDSLKEGRQFIIQLEQFLEGSSERIQWIEQEKGQATLCDTALAVAPYIEGVIGLAPAHILTSGTLVANGTMAYVKRNLGLVEAQELMLASPYTNPDQMLIYFAEDGIYPTRDSFNLYISNIVKNIAKILSGRLLVLFTSHESLKYVYKATVSQLRYWGIRLYAQGLTGGRSSMGSRFRHIHHSVLLGTNSFWEGIDVVGESLSAVLIPKLPFPTIDDPILLALGEQVGRERAFDEVTMPVMLLRLRQGAGRLIRSESDRGVVIILDRRVLEKSWGRAVFQSLPAATVQVGSHKNLVAVLEQWFGAATLEKWRKLLGAG